MSTLSFGEPESFIPGLGDQMDLIRELLASAKEYGLEVEVITWALKAMQQDPEQQPYEAFAAGYDEWVK